MLGFSLNVAHAHLLAGDFLPFLKAFGDKLGNVQISDNNGITDEHLPVGEGTVDFISLVRQLWIGSGARASSWKRNAWNSARCSISR